MKIRKNIMKLASKIEKMMHNSNDLAQDMTDGAAEKYMTEGLAELIRTAGAEGAVLLKNNGILPFGKRDKVSVFGRCQVNYFCVGYGSGGDVHPPYKVNLIDAMRGSGVAINEELASYYEAWCSKKENIPDDGIWGHWPMCYDEMKLKKEQIRLADISSNAALVVIGRAAGEDRENTLEKGSYYLTDTEMNNLDMICEVFDRVVVVLDCGNIIDMSWTQRYGDKISAILYAWQGGQESGNSVADVLTGKVNPCGKLCDTIAKTYADYPSSSNFGNKDFNNYREDIFVGYRYFETFCKDRVLYPFGFGLSYTDFVIKTEEFKRENGMVTLHISVTNTGKLSGKEVVQVYAECPQGALGKAARSLVAFAKTKTLAPDETQILSVSFEDYRYASYDDEGLAGHRSCYVLESGAYTFHVGSSVRDTTVAGVFTLDETVVLSQLQEVCSVQNPFKKLFAVQTDDGVIRQSERMMLHGRRDLARRIIENLPDEIGFSGDKGYQLADVKSGKVSLCDFIAQLTDEELEGLTRGHGFMGSPYGYDGNAGAFAGITEPLHDKFGIPAMITADGPAGIRLNGCCALLPCGSLLSCTWNTELIGDLFTCLSRELAHYGVDVLLSPGMNIHRDPLCGRNFEYYSEDPVLSGECAAAAISGIQAMGASACPKHFACNNQEVNRNYNDSRMSERALREIYLKGFEIAVKKAKPENIMTSYNKINGVWSHYNYDLVTTVLRNEWHYEGNVITDWWMRKSASPEFPLIRDNAYRVRAQVDVLMPGDNNHMAKSYKSDGTLLETVGKDGGLTRAEIERTAANVLRFALKRM